jgi:hypothetical protein
VKAVKNNKNIAWGQIHCSRKLMLGVWTKFIHVLGESSKKQQQTIAWGQIHCSKNQILEFSGQNSYLVKAVKKILPKKTTTKDYCLGSDSLQ